MTCVHLTELYQLCEKSDLKFSSSDLIRIVCPECGVKETCPSQHFEEVRDADESAGDEQSAGKTT